MVSCRHTKVRSVPVWSKNETVCIRCCRTCIVLNMTESPTYEVSIGLHRFRPLSCNVWRTRMNADLVYMPGITLVCCVSLKVWCRTKMCVCVCVCVCVCLYVYVWGQKEKKREVRGICCVTVSARSFRRHCLTCRSDSTQCKHAIFCLENPTTAYTSASDNDHYLHRIQNFEALCSWACTLKQFCVLPYGQSQNICMGQSK